MKTTSINKKIFYVVQFIELPSVKYACVPYSWITYTMHTEAKAEQKYLVAYPRDEDPLVTRHRAKRCEKYQDEWRRFEAVIKYASNIYKDAEDWIRRRNMQQHPPNLKTQFSSPVGPINIRALPPAQNHLQQAQPNPRKQLPSMPVIPLDNYDVVSDANQKVQQESFKEEKISSKTPLKNSDEHSVRQPRLQKTSAGQSKKNHGNQKTQLHKKKNKPFQHIAEQTQLPPLPVSGKFGNSTDVVGNRRPCSQVFIGPPSVNKKMRIENIAKNLSTVPQHPSNFKMQFSSRAGPITIQALQPAQKHSQQAQPNPSKQPNQSLPLPGNQYSNGKEMLDVFGALPPAQNHSQQAQPNPSKQPSHSLPLPGNQYSNGKQMLDTFGALQPAQNHSQQAQPNPSKQPNQSLSLPGNQYANKKDTFNVFGALPPAQNHSQQAQPNPIQQPNQSLPLPGNQYSNGKQMLDVYRALQLAQNHSQQAQPNPSKQPSQSLPLPGNQYSNGKEMLDIFAALQPAQNHLQQVQPIQRKQPSQSLPLPGNQYSNGKEILDVFRALKPAQNHSQQAQPNPSKQPSQSLPLPGNQYSNGKEMLDVFRALQTAQNHSQQAQPNPSKQPSQSPPLPGNQYSNGKEMLDVFRALQTAQNYLQQAQSIQSKQPSQSLPLPGNQYSNGKEMFDVFRALQTAQNHLQQAQPNPSKQPSQSLPLPGNQYSNGKEMLDVFRALQTAQNYLQQAQSIQSKQPSQSLPLPGNQYSNRKEMLDVFRALQSAQNHSQQAQSNPSKQPNQSLPLPGNQYSNGKKMLDIFAALQPAQNHLQQAQPIQSKQPSQSLPLPGNQYSNRKEMLDAFGALFAETLSFNEMMGATLSYSRDMLKLCAENMIEKVKGFNLAENDTALPPEYDPNDSRWTLKHRELKRGLGELLPGSSVYVSNKELKNCKRVSKDCRKLARNLLTAVFSKNALNVCSFLHAKAKTLKPGLDENASRVLLLYVEAYGRSHDWNVNTARIISSVRKKIMEMRNKVWRRPG